MNITGETKFFIGVAILSIVILIAGAFLFSKPETIIPREDLVAADSVSKGATESATYLVEFSDFQCPSCKAVAPLVDALVAQYGDQLRFVYRHFPLDQHPFAEISARAAEAAGMQGKFWEMHALLFENQERLSEDVINELAQSLALDMDQFALDLDSAQLKDKVQRDRSLGLRLGVNSTPTFFLNGKKLQLNSLNDITTIVAAELEKTQ